MEKFERLTQITLPALSFKGRTRAYIKIMGQMMKSDINPDDDAKRTPATVMKVVDLETGELARLICPSLLVSALRDEGEDYVGNCYEIQVSADKLPGKNYKSVEVYKIECPQNTDPQYHADVDQDNGGA